VSYGRRKILTRLTGAAIGASAVLASIPFIASLKKPKHREISNFYIDIDIGELSSEEVLPVNWMNNPFYIVKRSQNVLALLQQPNDRLLDPYSAHSSQPSNAINAFRSLRPDTFLASAICTHLPCEISYVAPSDESRWEKEYPNGLFYCPCCVSKFDLAGRVVKNVPAPRNLIIPNYRFLSDNVIRIGEI